MKMPTTFPCCVSTVPASVDISTISEERLSVSRNSIVVWINVCPALVDLLGEGVYIPRFAITEVRDIPVFQDDLARIVTPRDPGGAQAKNRGK